MPRTTTDAAALLANIERGEVEPLYLVAGEPVLALPCAERVASALAQRTGAVPRIVRRPPRLADLLSDLRTYSLFESAKVVVAVETALFADRQAAAELVDQAAEVLPIEQVEGSLGGAESAAASRLLQVLRLFGLDPAAATPERLLAELPEWVFLGGRAFRQKRAQRPRGKKQVEELRSGLVPLLQAALAKGLVGWAESDTADLAVLIEGGLPPGHSLVLVESSVAAEHPIVERLFERGAAVDLGRIEVDRRGEFGGLDALAQELERETGSSIDGAALGELARRTLRKAGDPGRREGVAADSTARLAAEYRKLAGLAAGGGIDLPLVELVVEDRGEEDVWKLLDAVGEGRPAEALERLRRMLYAAEDPMAVRLSLFSLLADFCRQLLAVQQGARLLDVALGERNYRRFQDRVAPRLQAELPGGAPNPLAGLHPYRLHRVYLAASRLRKVDLGPLPWRVLETELRLKGESGDGDVALAHLVSTLSAGASLPRPAPGKTPGLSGW